MSTPETARGPGRRWAVLALAALLHVGCSGIHARTAPVHVALRDRLEGLGNRSTTSRPIDEDPACAARTLETSVTAHPDADSLLALAELSVRAAERCNSSAAGPWYRDAAFYAAFALACAPDAATADCAAAIHNRAVEHLVRLAHSQQANNGRPWTEALAELGVAVVSPAAHLDPARLAEVEVARDFRVHGMPDHYSNAGFGVPLVAYRPNDRVYPRETYDRYFPGELRAAATAVMKPNGAPDADWRQRPQTLVLHDPFAERCVGVGERSVRLASDRTTPLAVELSWSPMRSLESIGLLQPDAARGESGLYLFQPYRPGKIPVVLVHGVHGSPDSWAQNFNRLQNDPFLAEHFQFWGFLYPTGDPLTSSAVLLRQTLRQAIATFDPTGADPALNQMVLVGHSMGGLLCKMMAQDSGSLLWDAVLRQPAEELPVPPTVTGRLVEELFYRPEPYVRRLVFISTPHEGTWFANRFIARFVQLIMRRSQDINADLADVARAEGRQALAPGVRIRRINGVGGLTPYDPLLLAIDEAGIDPSVPYHSIIPQIGRPNWHLPTDGLVAYGSSHINGADSEQITPGTHVAHEKDVVTEEIKRILCEHLAVVGANGPVR